MFARLLAAGLGSALMATIGPVPQVVTAQLSAFPGVAIVSATIDGDATAVQSFGASYNADLPFEIGSITKTFTATLFADMIVKHEVAPDDPIERYLPPGATAPEFQGAQITLEDLATQFSGLPRLPTNLAPADAADPYADYDEAKLLAFLASYKLTRAPGASFEYSNVGYGLLGYLLARRLGVDYRTAIRTRILEPLGMPHTDVAVPGNPIVTVGGHDADADPVPNWIFGVLAGAGGIVSTPDDMLRFARANLDTTQGPLAAAMQLAQRPRRDEGEGRRIGYAWITQPDGVVWHNGGTGGFRSFLGLDVADRRAIVLLANGFVDAVDLLGFNALDPVTPLPLAPPLDAAVPDAVLAQYAGRYRFSNGSVATITRDERGLLFALDTPPFHARLHAVSAADFTLRSPQIGLHFSGSGPGTTIVISAPGQPSDTGTRLP
ncbi:MAG: serine hydrolase domain-containing protein [Candidatus Velthaea sp.]|jgi:CubicO group peptidase (beta-lactamase class C family)